MAAELPLAEVERQRGADVKQADARGSCDQGGVNGEHDVLLCAME